MQFPLASTCRPAGNGTRRYLGVEELLLVRSPRSLGERGVHGTTCVTDKHKYISYNIFATLINAIYTKFFVITSEEANKKKNKNFI